MFESFFSSSLSDSASLQDPPCKEQLTKLVMTIVETEEMTEVVAAEVSNI